MNMGVLLIFLCDCTRIVGFEEEMIRSAVCNEKATEFSNFVCDISEWAWKGETQSSRCRRETSSRTGSRGSGEAITYAPLDRKDHWSTSITASTLLGIHPGKGLVIQFGDTSPEHPKNKYVCKCYDDNNNNNPWLMSRSWVLLLLFLWLCTSFLFTRVGISMASLRRFRFRTCWNVYR